MQKCLLVIYHPITHTQMHPASSSGYGKKPVLSPVPVTLPRRYVANYELRVNLATTNIQYMCLWSREGRKGSESHPPPPPGFPDVHNSTKGRRAPSLDLWMEAGCPRSWRTALTFTSSWLPSDAIIEASEGHFSISRLREIEPTGCMYISIYLSVCLSVYLSIYLPTYLYLLRYVL